MKRFKKRAPVLAIAALLLVVFVGGTFAYFSQTSTAENFLTALKYDSTITEAFIPPADGAFAPGVKVDKKVGVTNTGDVPMFVRITYEEFWKNFNGTTATYPTVDAVAEHAERASLIYDNDLTKSLVQKYTDNEDWVYGGDGYYYYDTILVKGASTTPFITSIMLNQLNVEKVDTYTVNYVDGDTKAIIAIPDVTEETLVDTKLLTGKPAGSYLVSVVMNSDTGVPEGNYSLEFTTQTVQAITDGLTSWAVSPAISAILTPQIPAAATVTP